MGGVVVDAKFIREAVERIKELRHGVRRAEEGV